MCAVIENQKRHVVREMVDAEIIVEVTLPSHEAEKVWSADFMASFKSPPPKTVTMTSFAPPAIGPSGRFEAFHGRKKEVLIRKPVKVRSSDCHIFGPG